jgi:hypothetical protein
MSDLLDLVVDTFPANNDSGVPLKSVISITLSGLAYDETSLIEGLFVDFLQSPGYKGIVKGEVTVSGIAGNTVINFTPTLPLAAQIEYIVNLTGILDDQEEEIEGFVSFSFETGTGSIETIPATVSTSVLSAGLSEASILQQGSLEPLAVISTSPVDRSVQIDPDTREIVITFNKEINPSSVNADNFIVHTTPISDHPEANIHSLGDLAKVVEVSGKQIKIKI